MNLQGNLDPVTTLINKLSSGQELRVKIQTETDNILTKNHKKSLIQPLNSQTKTLNLNLSKLEKFLSIFSNRRCPNFPNQEQQFILERVKHIPVYTVVNGTNEVIMASPRNIHSEGSLNWIRDKCEEIFNWTYDEGPITVALFFMNMEDAENYMHEVCKKEPREAESLGLKVKTVGLDRFYRLNRTSPPKMQFRLVANLDEIDKAIHQCKDRFFYNINPKQRYSKTWFQGNPIYIIKLTQIKVEKLLSQYNFHTDLEKKVVFFSKEDAVKAWKIYTTKHLGDDLNRKPHLEIYNLESLISDLENTKVNNLIDLYLVPPYEGYRISKTKPETVEPMEQSSLEIYSYQAKLKLKEFKRFYKGLMWLLTSDTLPSEENSW